MSELIGVIGVLGMACSIAVNLMLVHLLHGAAQDDTRDDTQAQAALGVQP